MKAILYEQFGENPSVETVKDPECSPDGIVVKVLASGLCRSDWHGWMGHDEDIILPHVPGHELVGQVVETGRLVTKFNAGDRVTVPFVSGCGHCEPCQMGNHQICDNQFQPGFTAWGSFAEYVELRFADINVRKLPDYIESVAAVSLGCRFTTSFRGVVDQARLRSGEWIAIFGCGGVGLSAIMIAKALGAQVIAVDINNRALELAKSIGADYVVNSLESSAVEKIMDITHGGVHVSLDALGSKQTCINSISSLRKRGRHIQIGLMMGEDYMPEIPMHLVISRELEIFGSHGIQSFRFSAIFEMMKKRLIRPEMLVNRIINLEEAISALMNMNTFNIHGVTVINRFS
jgi:alcohol dehydrogenase